MCITFIFYRISHYRLSLHKISVQIKQTDDQVYQRCYLSLKMRLTICLFVRNILQ